MKAINIQKRRNLQIKGQTLIDYVNRTVKDIDAANAVIEALAYQKTNKISGRMAERRAYHVLYNLTGEI